MKKLNLLIAAALFAVFASSAQAAVVDFEGVVFGGVAVPVTPYTESGMNFVNNNGDSALDGVFGPFSGAATNGTDVLGFAAADVGILPPSYIIMTASGGASFDLLSVDSSIIFPDEDGAGILDIVGHFSGGGTITASVGTLIGAWTTSANGFGGALAGFDDLIQVDFIASGFDSAGIDNIVVAVPAPAGIALFGLGLMMLGLRRKG